MIQLYQDMIQLSNQSTLFSGTIRRLLVVFVTGPGQRFYLRQLCQLINSSPRPVQLGLQKLEKAGILKAQKEANIKFYSLNKESPIYEEIKGIVLKTDAVGETLRAGLRDIKDIKCAFIYGSVARDKERKGSDIDIVIIGNVDAARLSRAVSKLEEDLKREVSVITFSVKEWKAALNSKKAFVMDVLKNKKLILIGSLDEI